MQILGDLSNRDDLELILYSMILINTVLNAIPDQDTFYDVSDAYEEQGMQRIIQHYFKNPVKEDASANYTNYKQIVQQMELYEVKLDFFKLILGFSLIYFKQSKAALLQEDGDESNMNNDDLNSSFSSNSTTSSNHITNNKSPNSLNSNSNATSSLAPNLRYLIWIIL